MANFFISYSRKDAAIANKIRNHIYKLDSGHEVFLDVKSLGVGTNWKAELQRKVRSCDYFICIHSIHSLKSKFVKDELEWVGDAELKTGMRKLIVYRLGYAEIIPEIASYQILDATDNFSIDFFKLMQGIFSGNSFYNVEYELMLEDEFWYKGKLWIEAPKKFLSKIQLVEYRFDYGWDDKNRIRTVKSGAKSIINKFGISFTTKIHFTLFVMIYLWNTKELPFVKKIHLSY
ncbi:MAG: toll/interleukin-1 receptor domain-containing protein [Chitinophagaceae bacterium]